uniref:Uncharacterized protein n=1 Tax=mine drainage metagenome TaxID=410659 RepID=E6QLQ6_9ZZZZ
MGTISPSIWVLPPAHFNNGRQIRRSSLVESTTSDSLESATLILLNVPLLQKTTRLNFASRKHIHHETEF